MALIVATSDGVRVRVDAVPLTDIGEYVALCNLRMTYELWHGELVWRDHFKIKHGHKGPIFASHVHGTAIDARYRQPLSIPAQRWTDSDSSPRF